MTDLLAPTLAAEAVSAFAAVALARRRSDHKPVAFAFVCMLFAHLARLVLDEVIDITCVPRQLTT